MCDTSLLLFKKYKDYFVDFSILFDLQNTTITTVPNCSITGFPITPWSGDQWWSEVLTTSPETGYILSAVIISIWLDKILASTCKYRSYRFHSEPSLVWYSSSHASPADISPLLMSSLCLWTVAKMLPCMSYNIGHYPMDVARVWHMATHFNHINSN